MLPLFRVTAKTHYPLRVTAYREALDQAIHDRDEVARALREMDEAIAVLRRLVAHETPPVADRADPQTNARERALVAPTPVPSSGLRSRTLSPDGNRAAILAVLNDVAGPLGLDEIHRSLVGRGWTTSSKKPKQLVASVLSKLVASGYVVRSGYNAYSPANRSLEDPRDPEEQRSIA